jgi:hypothetical protein
VHRNTLNARFQESPFHPRHFTFPLPEGPLGLCRIRHFKTTLSSIIGVYFCPRGPGAAAFRRARFAARPPAYNSNVECKEKQRLIEEYFDALKASGGCRHTRILGIAQ